MKIHIIRTDNDHTQQIMERIKGFLRPVCENQREPITLCMGHLYAGDDVSMEQLRDCIRAWLRGNAADLILFYGNDSGSQLGRMVGAEPGFHCQNQCVALQWLAENSGIGIGEESTNSNIHDKYVRRKIYSAHGDGLFRIGPGKAVFIVSPNGERAALDELETKWQQETSLNWFGCCVTFTNLIIAADFYPDIQLLHSETKEAVQDLGSARLVLVGGKGLKTKDNYQRLKRLAGKLQAVCACTRPAAMSGWADFSEVVGISGTSLQAEVCVTFGVSGAAPFLYGIENVKHVIAINTDQNAPIFARADYGMIEDGVELLSYMETQISERESS